MDQEKTNYPLVIIGAGPAGLTASIYASRYKIEHAVVGEAIGGLAFEAHKIGNFPTEEEISGMDLVAKMQKHAESLGAPIIVDKVVSISRQNGGFKITTQGKKNFTAEAVLLAVGTTHRKMNLPDEDKYIGRGVSYCATCDAMFYKGKTVAVVGGSDSANTASLYLSEIASKVYQIYRKGSLRGETIWIHKIQENKKIEVIYNTEVTGLEGEEKLEAVKLSSPYQGQDKLKVDGLFIEIGTVPQKVLIDELSLETDEHGYIKVNPDQQTGQEAVWAAGDITSASNNFHQIIVACSEGAIAAESIFMFFQKKKRR